MLFANPPSRTDGGSGLEKVHVRTGSRWPFSYLSPAGAPFLYYAPFPFFLATAASVLRERGHEVSGVDCLVTGWGRDRFLEFARASGAGAVVLETSPATEVMDMENIRPLAEQGWTVIVAGPHATARARELLAAHPWVRFVLRGEYEYSLADVAEALEKGIDPRNARIPGLVVRDGEGLHEVPGLGAVTDPDRLPFPARDLFPGGGFSHSGYRDNIAPEKFCLQLHSGRGCPRGCSFCLWNQVLFPGRGYRPFAPARVADEIEFFIQSFRPHSFYFDDDSFTADPAHARAICGCLRDRGLRVTWYCMADLEGLSPDLLREMAAAGCRGVKFGVEGAWDRVLVPEGKKSMGARAREIAAAAAAVGIRTHATFCVGFPEETPESLAATRSLILSLKTDSIQCSLCIPYPGTSLYRRLEREGRLLTREMGAYDGSRPLIANPRLGNDELRRFRARIAREWVRRRVRSPAWLKRQAGYFRSLAATRGLRGAAAWIQGVKTAERGVRDGV